MSHEYMEFLREKESIIIYSTVIIWKKKDIEV